MSAGTMRSLVFGNITIRSSIISYKEDFSLKFRIKPEFAIFPFSLKNELRDKGNLSLPALFFTALEDLLR